MKKNISTQEAYVRTTLAVLTLLLALFVAENSIGKILFATLAAILAGTAFLRTCPINKLIGRNMYDEVTTSQQPQTTHDPGSQASDPDKTETKE